MVEGGTESKAAILKKYEIPPPPQNVDKDCLLKVIVSPPNFEISIFTCINIGLLN